MADEVVLRAVRRGDLAVFYEDQLDPEGAAMAAFTPRDRAAFDAHWARIVDDPAIVKRTVQAGGEVAGYVVCFEQDGERRVGYWIGRRHWGRGVASRALAELLRLVPERPLTARVARHNAGSIRVLEKCGFVEVAAAGGSPAAAAVVEELVFRLE